MRAAWRVRENVRKPAKNMRWMIGYKMQLVRNDLTPD